MIVAIRFFRSLIGGQDEFYVKHLIEKRILGSVLDVMFESKDKNNLLSSACLELFEHIKKENLKDFVKHLVTEYREVLEDMSSMPTFQELILRYDQTQGYTSGMDYFLEADDDVARKPPQNARLMEHLAVDPTQEEYWNTSDPEDEDEDEQHAAAEKAQATSSASTPSKPLVDYPSDEEVDENTDPNKDQNKDDETNKLEPAEDSDPTAVAPLERLAEKRRREEDDDDELEKLMQNKRRNSNASSGSTPSSGVGRKRKSFSTGSGNGAPKKIAISLSPALRSGGAGRSDDES
jgi:protein phosphatase 4 regulatory subunit 3